MNKIFDMIFDDYLCQAKRALALILWYSLFVSVLIKATSLPPIFQYFDYSLCIQEWFQIKLQT